MNAMLFQIGTDQAPVVVKVLKDSDTVSRVLNLASLILGIVLGVALEPIKAHLLTRHKLMRAERDIYDDIGLFLARINKAQGEPFNPVTLKPALLAANFSFFNYYRDQEKYLFMHLAGSRWLNLVISNMQSALDRFSHRMSSDDSQENLFAEINTIVEEAYTSKHLSKRRVEKATEKASNDLKSIH
jgi:predicted HD phosphohydrolase